MTPSTTQARQSLSISELNQLSRHALEQAVGRIWVTGEISNLSQPASGHAYFSLKDSQAQVRCAFFRQYQSSSVPRLQNGQHVQVLAQVSLYEPRGDYQLIIKKVTLSGDGLLQRQFEALKKKCAQAGLFDPQHKKSIPTLSQSIGIISSATGAALQDILTVLKRRFPLIPLTLYPTQVQGKPATQNIVAMIEAANQDRQCDLLILARGGGSLEDLWCFNEEAVALAIYNSSIPVITGIGHEIDLTIADLVADQRAATPSAAAEIASPDQEQYRQFLKQALHLLRQNLLQKKTSQ